MCLACALQMFRAMEDLPPSTGIASHEPADAAARFACDAPADEPAAAPAAADKRKPEVTGRE